MYRPSKPIKYSNSKQFPNSLSSFLNIERTTQWMNFISFSSQWLALYSFSIFWNAENQQIACIAYRWKNHLKLSSALLFLSKSFVYYLSRKARFDVIKMRQNKKKKKDENRENDSTNGSYCSVIFCLVTCSSQPCALLLSFRFHLSWQIELPTPFGSRGW